MLRRAFVRSLLLLGLIPGISTGLGCGGSKNEAPPRTPMLVLHVSPESTEADGRTVDVTVVAVAADGSAGEGSVGLRVTAGLVDDQEATAVTLANGQASAKWGCDSTGQTACLRSPVIIATWSGAVASETVTFSRTSQDGGGDAGIEPDAAVEPVDGSTPEDAAVTDDAQGDAVMIIQQISWSSTTCGGQTCTIMGVKGSGFNEQAQVTFRVTGFGGSPAPGVVVSFAIPHPPLDTVCTASGVTNADGLVMTNVSAGRAVGAFSVKAVVLADVVETTSPTIGIRGAKPANHGFILQCSPVNAAAFVTPAHVEPIDIDCSVKVVDRHNNAVGTGTPVNFKTEAGTIPSEILTKAYEPDGDNSEEGTATLVFSTFSSVLPEEVEPLAAYAEQYPLARLPEPHVHIGANVTRNPRDGLVSLMAYVRGEEFFFDLNQNGIHDPSEPFIDQGEPFVDANDSGDYELGEIYIDANANGQYDPASGMWDDDTTIWTDTKMLYTGSPVIYDDIQDLASHTESGIHPDPFANGCDVPDGGLPPRALVDFDLWVTDKNLNRPEHGTTFGAQLVGGKGTMTTSFPTLADDYGIAMERRLLNQAKDGPCEGTSTLCLWQWLFYAFEGGCSGGLLHLVGSDTDAPTACATDEIIYSLTVHGVTTWWTTRGGVLY